MKDNRKTIQVLVILTIMFTVIGGSLAYWNWNTTEEQKTNVVFTLTQDFSCAADGGGNITSNDVSLAPTTCTDTSRAIKRKVTVTPTVNKDDLTISMDLWLNIKDIGEGLSESENFKYVLTTSDSSCEEGTILASGNFKGLQSSDQAYIMMNKKYSASISEEYYLYIWLDKEETSSSTMNQTFSLSLGGSCTNDPMTPELDDGMIPVTIAEDGTVTTVSADDSGWYDYDNQQWANVVLVKENATEGVTGSQSRSYYQSNLSNNVEVVENDILGYYVWIPRYKYRIPYQQQTCSELTSPTLEENPGCYAPPYIISDEDRAILIEHLKTQCVYFTDDGWYYCGDPTGGKTIDYFVETLLNGGTILDEAVAAEYNLEDWIGYRKINIHYGMTLQPQNKSKQSYPIDIVFESKDTPRTMGNAVNTYYTHPAFWWDDNNNRTTDNGEMLAGIWVSKFMNKPDDDVYGYYISFVAIGDTFNYVRTLSSNGNKFGLSSNSTNSHMMKNSEYGAISYLAHSKYGISNTMIKKISIPDYIAEESTIGKNYIIDYTSGTTNNKSGVFTLSIDTIDNWGSYYHINKSYWLMGNYNNQVGDSGFNTMPERKYYDLYTINQINMCTLEICGGHALYEVDDGNSLTYTFLLPTSMDNEFYDGPWIARHSELDTEVYGVSGTTSDLFWFHPHRQTIIIGFGE